MKKKWNLKEKWVLLAYLLISILFAVPSIRFFWKNKTILKAFYSNNFFYEKIKYVYQQYLNGFLYIAVFIALALLYYIILKRHKVLFRTKKQVIGFVVLIGVIFTIIIPCTSLDVYSYIGNGWVESHYQENPYYTSIKDISQEHGWDWMLMKVAVCWQEEPVIYGPAWSLLCRGLTSLCFGEVDIALALFKLANLIVWIVSIWLIGKITNKKFFMLLFGLNPLVLLEVLTNVHNDIFLVFFLLLTIYFGVKKKNIALGVLFLAIATAIKYVSILFLPFFLIYMLRKENVRKRIAKALVYGIEFIIVIAVFYALYIQDLAVFAGIFIQQEKYSRSVFLILYFLLEGNEALLGKIKLGALAIFAIVYAIVVIRMLLAKEEKLKWSKMMQTYQMFLVIFTFVLVTNFNAWYILWLFPTIFWQKRTTIEFTQYLSIGAVLTYTLTYATLKDDASMGIPYLICMFGTAILLMPKERLLEKMKCKYKMKKRKE